MSYPHGAADPTRDHPARRVRPGLVGWAFRREIALAHGAYWRGCRGPATTFLAMALYPVWLLVAVPLAFVLCLVKVALLGAVMAAVGVAAWRGLAAQPVRARPRR